jgi:predicted HicB family RNase H-like nuclease
MTLSKTPGRPPLPDYQKAASHLHMRVRREQKAAYVKAAVAAKKKLSEWVTETLDRAC